MSDQPHDPQEPIDSQARNQTSDRPSALGNEQVSNPVSKPPEISEPPEGKTPDPAIAPLDRYECRACGYTYEPTKGDSTGKIPAMTRFEALPLTWRCPVCGVKTTQFQNIGELGKASGFKENLDYGFGVNRLTPGQKNLLIFGALALGILFFISLYGLR